MVSTELHGPWRFRLVRKVDETGVSGTGHVADGVQFEDGTCALHWRGPLCSTAFYTAIETVIAIHGHDGKTEIVWLDQAPTKAFKRGAEACMLDGIENAPFSSVGGLEARPDLLKAPHYIQPADVEEYLRGYRAYARESYGDDWGSCSFGWQPAMVIGGEG